MKKILIIFLLNTFTFFAQQQTIDVFSCNDSRRNVSINECTNNEVDIIKNCIYFEGSNLFEVNVQSDKNFQAHDEIHITADFHDKTDDNHTHHYGSSNKANFEVAYMNAWWPNVFIKYDKLEIGNTLPQSVNDKVEAFINANIDDYDPLHPNPNHINPFLEWEIKVETTFKHLASGFEKTIFGFYYEDFERDYVNEEWNSVATPYIFRTRYAPPIEGNWQARTKITVGNGAEIYLSDPYFFIVNDEGQHGFVKVHENKRNLKLEDRMIMPVGHNLTWAGFKYQDEDKADWKDFDHWMDFHNSWEVYKNEGSRYARTHLHNGIMDVEWEYVGNYKNRLHYAWEMDKLIDFFEHNDMLIDFNLMMHHQLTQKDKKMHKFDYDAYSVFDEQEAIVTSYQVEPRKGYGYYMQLEIHNVLDFIKGETNGIDNQSHKYLKQRLRYLISRYCYSTSIYMLELNSEMNNIGIDNYTNSDTYTYTNSNVKDAVYNYNEVMCGYIKNSLQHNEHLLAVNYTGSPVKISEPNYEYVMEPDESFGLPMIDVINFNNYSNIPEKLYIAELNNALNQYNLIKSKYGEKPIFYGEAGSEDIGCWDDVRQTNIADLMTLGFTGIAGFNTWYGVTDERVFQPVKRASDHINGDDVINTLSDGNGDWSTRIERNNHDILTFPHEFPGDHMYQHFYYKAANRQKIVGFVKNNTYNFYNYGQPCYKYEDTDNDGDLDPVRITVGDKYDEIKIRTWEENDFYLLDLLENHNYTIHYYAFDNYLESACFNTSINGHQKLKYPSSTEILWYVAYVENCMNGMILKNEQQNNEIENLNLIDKGITKLEVIENSKQMNNNTFAESNSIKIHPNPTKGSFEILTNPENILKIELMDLQGNIIYTNLKDKINREIDISFLSSGLYNIKIEEVNKLSFHKIVKL